MASLILKLVWKAGGSCAATVCGARAGTACQGRALGHPEHARQLQRTCLATQPRATESREQRHQVQSWITETRLGLSDT